MSNRKEVSKTRVLESVLMLIIMMQLGEGKGVAGTGTGRNAQGTVATVVM